MAKADESKVIFNTMCQMMESIKWKYKTEERSPDYIISTSAVGEDLSMHLNIHVDTERQVMYLKSPMPFKTNPDKTEDMVKAVTIANWDMLNGCFEMDMDDGYVAFKMVIPFMQSMISTEVCRYMIMLSCNMIDKFNDKLKAINDGEMTLAQFKQFVKGN